MGHAAKRVVVAVRLRLELVDRRRVARAGPTVPVGWRWFVQVVVGVLGVALVALVVVDLLWTTLWVDGSAGPLTGRATTLAWRAASRLGRGHHRLLSTFGPSVLFATVLGWIALLGVGWTLVYSADPTALRDTRDDQIAGAAGRVWFVAYTMFTVGNGDFTPRDGVWQVVSSVVGASGLFAATLSITYLLSVVSAVVGKRSFAGQVLGLGRSAEQFVLSGWDGRTLHSLDRHLAELASQLSRLTEQYLSYPVLQYYHAASPDKSPVKAVAVLDDALTLLAHGVVGDLRPEAATLASARSAVDSFIEDTREAAAVSPAPEAPPHPALGALRQHGIATVDDREFERCVEGIGDRRRTLLGLLWHDGWEWSG